MKKMVSNLKKVMLMLTLVFAVVTMVNAQTKTVVKVADLQKSITDQIAKDYAGYTIDNAFKVVNNKVVNYEVNINKEKQMVCLAFDQSGKFLKVVEPRPMHASLAPNTKAKSLGSTTNNTKMKTAVKK
jgi:hypothetical protein